MPRLFTGLEIPADIALELSLLRGGLSGARWIESADYHLTLRFIGDIDERTAHDIYDELSTVDRAPVVVSLDRLASFGSDRPRSIIVRAEPNAALSELQAEHERIMRRIGLPAEPRKFTPHVTLARLKGVSPAAAASYLDSRSYFVRRTFTASRFVLYSSRDSVGGGPYVVEAAYPLDRVR